MNAKRELLERMTTEELAEVLGVHPYTLANWRIQGKGPTFVKMGNRVYYLRADVEAWEEENKRRSTAG